MPTLITVVHIVTCALIILVVLLQSGKGAEISASFSGSSQTVFGSSGGANFFTRFTSILATIFFVTSLTLTLLGGQSKKSLFETAPLSGGTPAAGATAPSVAVPPAVPASGGAPAAAAVPAQKR